MDGSQEFERTITRRALLKKVAVYAPPLVLGGRLLLDAGIAAGATPTCSTSTVVGSGSSVTSSLCLSGSGSSASAGCSTPLQALQADLATLQGIPASGRREQDRKVAKAIERLTDATDPSNWTDGYTLAGKGERVFDDLKDAVDELTSSHSSDPTLAAVAADIVTQAGTVANDAVQNAGLTGRAADRAQRALDRGAQQVAAGRSTSAIDAYARAWRIATHQEEQGDN